MSTEVAISQGLHNQRFSYATYPRSLYYSSYRNVNDSEKPFYGNIMYDKRVIRGNTWALRRLAQEALVAEELEDRNQLKQKRNNIRQQIQAKLETHKRALSKGQQARHVQKSLSKRGTGRKKEGIKSNGSSSNEGSLSESALAVFEDILKVPSDSTKMKDTPETHTVENSIHPNELEELNENIDDGDKKGLDNIEVDQLLDNQIGENEKLDIINNQSGVEEGEKIVDREIGDVENSLRGEQAENIDNAIIAEENKHIAIENEGLVHHDTTDIEVHSGATLLENEQSLSDSKVADMFGDELAKKLLDELKEEVNNEIENKLIAEEKLLSHLETITEEESLSDVLNNKFEIENEKDINSSADLIDNQINDLQANRDLLQLMATGSQIELHPLPQIESLNEASEYSLKQVISKRQSDTKEFYYLIEHEDELYEDQITQALKVIVDAAMSSAELELQYEMEIDEVKMQHEQLREEHEKLIAEHEDTKQIVNFIEEQKNSLTSEYEHLEQEKLKFFSHQIAWDFVNNELLPTSIDKLIEYRYIDDGLKGETKHTAQMHNVEKRIKKKSVQINDMINNDFMPWLFTEVYTSVAHTTLNHMLNDTIDLKSSFCRNNAKKYFMSALATLNDD